MYYDLRFWHTVVLHYTTLCLKLLCKLSSNYFCQFAFCILKKRNAVTPICSHMKRQETRLIFLCQATVAWCGYSSTFRRIISEDRGIESCRQLLFLKWTTIDAREKRRRIWKRRSKGAPAKPTTIDAWNERARNRLDSEDLKCVQETRFEGCGLKREERQERKLSRGRTW